MPVIKFSDGTIARLLLDGSDEKDLIVCSTYSKKEQNFIHASVQVPHGKFNKGSTRQALMEGFWEEIQIRYAALDISDTAFITIKEILFGILLIH